MKNRIIKCIAFVCLLGLVLSGVYKILSWKDTSGDYISVVEQMNKTDKGLMDVVFVGSSHVYRGVYPSVIWKEKGYSAFDLSVSEQNKYNAYYNLKELLKKQTPKVVFVETYALMFDRNDMPGNLYRNLLAVNRGISSVKMITETIEDKEDRTYFLTGWPLIHTRYRELKMYDFLENPINDYYRGEVIMNGNETATIAPEIISLKEKEEISESNRKWIDRLSKLSQENGFELVFYMTPYVQSMAERRIENGAREYIESLGYTYIDLKDHMEEMDFVPENDMGDVWHCNLEGARKVSEFLADYIEENYSLEDHRGDKAYYQWDMDLKHHEHVLLERRINGVSDIQELAEILMECDDIILVLSLEGDYFDVLPYMELFDVNPETVTNGGKWIVSKGAVTKIMDNNPGEMHNVELTKYDVFTVQCVQNGDYSGNVLYNGTGVNECSDGLNIIIYDDFENKLLGTHTVP